MFTRSSVRVLLLGVVAIGIFLAPALAAAQAAQPAPVGRLGLGRPATPGDIQRINIDVRPDGQGLPAGGASATDGGPIFAGRCAGCHGAAGEGTPAGPRLVDPTPFQAGVNQPTIGNYWPYATTVWDYIHRAMPFDAPGSLSSDEVYALTAYLLAQNGLIGPDDRMDARSLPAVKMPNQPSFSAPDPRPDVP
jgi:S-disulfanyl-L-cysteine oxidoreductase SoxD